MDDDGDLPAMRRGEDRSLQSHSSPVFRAMTTGRTSWSSTPLRRLRLVVTLGLHRTADSMHASRGAEDKVRSAVQDAAEAEFEIELRRRQRSSSTTRRTMAITCTERSRRLELFCLASREGRYVRDRAKECRGP